MTAPQPLLRFGDRILLHHLLEDGFVASDGFADMRAGLAKLSKATGTIVNIEDAVFAIHPKQVYVSHKRFKETMVAEGVAYDEDSLEMYGQLDGGSRRSRRAYSTKSLKSHERDADVDLEALKAQVLKERETNQALVDRFEREVLQFGDDIQLYHVSSGKYLCVAGDTAAEGDPKCLAVVLARPSDAVIWKVEPRFKLNSEGEDVHAGDQACLRNIAHAQYLNVNPNFSLDDGRVEVLSHRKTEGFRFHQYAQFTTAAMEQEVLNGGETVRFYNKETEGFLFLESPAHAVTVLHTPDRTTGVSNSLFTVEFLTNHHGGLGKWSDHFRLRHTGSGLLLGAGKPKNGDGDGDGGGEGATSYELGLFEPEAGAVDPATVFSFLATYGGDEFIKLQSSFRIVNVSTGTCLHVLNDEGDVDPGELVQFGVELASTSLEQDTLVLVRVPLKEIQDMNTVKASGLGLKKYGQTFAGGSFPSDFVIDMADRLLTKLILFVTENSSDPNPLTRQGTPILSRQNLILDQGVLAVVVDNLRRPFESLVQLQGIEDRPEHAKVLRIAKLCYRLVVQVMRDNKQCRAFMAKETELMQHQLGHGLSVATEALMELFRNNKELLYSLDPSAITNFVNLIRESGRRASFMEFLRTVVTCNLVGVPRNQNFAVDLIMGEEPSILFQIELQGGRVMVLNDVGGEEEKKWVPLAEFTAAPETEHHNEYIAMSLHTLANVCRGRNKHAQDLVSKVYSFELLMALVTDQAVPYGIRAGALHMIKHAHIDTHPSEYRAPVSHVVVWDDLGKERAHKADHDERFDGLRVFVSSWLGEYKSMVMTEVAKNYFAQACLSSLKDLAAFGYLSLEQIVQVIPLLVDVLDGRTDLLAPGVAPRASDERFERSDQTAPVFQCKHTILDTLETMMGYMLDSSKLGFLALFKTLYAREPSDEGDRRFQGLEGHFQQRVAEPSPFDRDDVPFAPVLLDLVRYNDLRLNVKAFRVLFQHFGRQESLLEVAERTNILVAEDSVAIYQTCVKGVAELRSLITDGITLEEEARVKQLMAELTQVALAHANNQHILRHVGAHKVASRLVDLYTREQLQGQGQGQGEGAGEGAGEAEAEADSASHRETLGACYRFLQAFVKGNSANQEVLAGHVGSFMRHLGLRVGVTTLLTAVYTNNRPLSQAIDRDVVLSMFKQLKPGSLDSRYLQFLGTITVADDRPIKQNQDFVFGLLEENPQVVRLYKGEDGFQAKLDAVRNGDHEDPNSELSYHLALLACLTNLAAGLNATTEAKLQAWFPLGDVYRHIADRNTPTHLKCAVVAFFTAVFLETERPADVFTVKTVWDALDVLADDLVALAESRAPHDVSAAREIIEMVRQLCDHHSADLVAEDRVATLERLVDGIVLFKTEKALARTLQDALYVVGLCNVSHALTERCEMLHAELSSLTVADGPDAIGATPHEGEEHDVAEAKEDFCEEFRAFIFPKFSRPGGAGAGAGARAAGRKAVGSSVIAAVSGGGQHEGEGHGGDGDDGDEDEDDDEDNLIQESVQFKQLVELFVPPGSNNGGGNVPAAAAGGGGGGGGGGSGKDEGGGGGSVVSTSHLVRKLVDAITGGKTGISEEQIKMHLKILTSMALREDESGSKAVFQNYVHDLGATKMVIDMVSGHLSHNVLVEVLQCGIAIFSDGNDYVQHWMYEWFKGDSQRFFAACFYLVQLAQNEVPEVAAWNKRYDDVKVQLGIDTERDDILALLPKLVESVPVKEVLRFLQVICENHFAPIQRYLHEQQHNVQSFDLVLEVTQYLFALEQFGIDNHNIDRCIQVFDTITELCQGPIREHQYLLAATKLPAVCNRLLSNDFEVPNLTEVEAEEMENQEFDLKRTIADCLLALLEGCRSDVVPSHLRTDIDLGVMKALLEEGYAELMEQESQFATGSLWQRIQSIGRDLDIDECEGALMAFQCFFLLLTMADYLPEVRERLEEWHRSPDFAAQHEFFLSRTGSIEINDGTDLQKVYFRKPDICFHLSENTKQKVIWEIDRSSPNKIVEEFQGWFAFMFAEMKQLDKLENHRFHLFFELRDYDILLTKIEFFLACVINLVLLATYDLKDVHGWSWNDLANCWEDTCADDDLLAQAPNGTSVSDRCRPFMVEDPGGGGGGAGAVFGSCDDWWGSLDIKNAATEIPSDARTLIYVLGGLLLLLTATNFVLFVAKFADLVIRYGIDNSPGTWVGAIVQHKNMKELKSSGISWWRLLLVQSVILASDQGMLFVTMMFVMAVVAMAYPLTYCLHLFIMVQLSGDLRNVIKAVTKNGKSLLLTACLGFFVVYVYGIVGFEFFRDHYVSGDYGVLCGDLFQCSATTLSGSLRKGDVGEVMEDTEWAGAGLWFFEFSYFAIVLTIMLNIIFGIIIDTFGELRVEKAVKFQNITRVCCICGIDANTYDRFGAGFERHTKRDHNMWQYAFFYVHLMLKDSSDYTGPELFVYRQIEDDLTDWYPLGQAIELLDLKAKEEQAQNLVQNAVKDTLSATKVLLAETAKMNKAMEESKHELNALLEDGTKQIQDILEAKLAR